MQVSSRYLLLAGLDHTKARQGELSRFLHFLCSNLGQKVQDLISHLIVLLPYFPNTCRKKQHVTQLLYCPVAFVVSPFFKPAASANSVARAPLVITFTDLAIAFIGAIALDLLKVFCWTLRSVGDWSQTATKNTKMFESTHQASCHDRRIPPDF